MTTGGREVCVHKVSCRGAEARQLPGSVANTFIILKNRALQALSY